MAKFKFEPLDPARHKREGFTCESPPLTDFLKTRARKEMDSGLSACFVLTIEDDPSCVVGYYTLSSATIATSELPVSFAKKLPRYKLLPATLLGRLARSSAFPKQGVGGLLLVDALKRAWLNRQTVGSIAVITDPKDALAQSFYRKYGFARLNETSLFVPMKDIEPLFSLNPGTL